MGVTVNATKDFTCDSCAGTSVGQAETVEVPTNWTCFENKVTKGRVYLCDSCSGESTDGDKATVYDLLFGT